MARRSYRKKPEKQTSAAMQKVKALIAQAEEIQQKHPRISDQYARLARRIAMKHKLRLPPDIKRRICRGCQAFLTPGKTARIRTNRGKVIIYCMACKRIMRICYK